TQRSHEAVSSAHPAIRLAHHTTALLDPAKTIRDGGLASRTSSPNCRDSYPGMPRPLCQGRPYRKAETPLSVLTADVVLQAHTGADHDRWTMRLSAHARRGSSAGCVPAGRSARRRDA